MIAVCFKVADAVRQVLAGSDFKTCPKSKTGEGGLLHGFVQVQVSTL
jgi:hypothetical protein